MTALTPLPTGSVTADLDLFEALEHLTVPFAIYDGEGGCIAQSQAFAEMSRRLSERARAAIPDVRAYRAGEIFDWCGLPMKAVPLAGSRHWLLSPARRFDDTGNRDALTGLPDRAALRLGLEEATADEALSGRSALLLLDLDRFKSVNDTLGHPVGDALLRKAVDRIVHCVGSDQLVCRLGGDEFAVVLRADDVRATAADVARRLVDLVARPFLVDTHVISIGVSIGIALCGEAAGGSDRLLTRADLALYAAKESGRGRFRFFDRHLEDRAKERRDIEQDLRRALALRQLDVYYQPQVAADDGRVTGCEALVRWRHPERGAISPATFIPIAEETGLIVPIGDWVLRTACEEAKRWSEDIRVAVNLSPIQLLHPDVVNMVGRALARSGIAPHRLELEITEGVFLQDTDATLAVLGQLKAMGVRIAMDDFGTGYSSLRYLRAFAFDKVKIDQSFVREMETSADAAAIVRAVLSLGSSLGISVTAEGVETQCQLEHLRAHGCGQLQGYLIGRPMPAKDLMFNSGRQA